MPSRHRQTTKDSILFDIGFDVVGAPIPTVVGNRCRLDAGRPQPHTSTVILYAASSLNHRHPHVPTASGFTVIIRQTSSEIVIRIAVGIPRHAW